MFTEDELQQLLTCPKKVINPPLKKHRVTDRGYCENSFTVKAEGTGIEYLVFIKQNSRFPENFSVGLLFNPPDQKGLITLVRCNGKHGGTISTPHHAHFHIHKATAEALNKGMLESGEIEITDQYADLDNAIQCFVKMINLDAEDRSKFFPPPIQPNSTQLDLGI